MQNFSTLVTFPDLIASSQEMMDCMNLAQRVSETSLSVFIWGEKGTGGLQLAHYIHQNSERRNFPFLVFSAEGLTKDAQSRELFGLIQDGQRYIGKLELAQGGTVFIDRVDLLDESVQKQLFVTLHEREFEPANTHKIVKLDARIISSSLYSPTQISDKKLIRTELLYRLEGVPFGLPSLRSRGADVIRIAERFIDLIGQNYGMPQKRLTIQAVQEMFRYEWLGNAEELFGCIEKACFSTGNELVIDSDDLAISKITTGAQLKQRDNFPDILSFDNTFLLPYEDVKKILLRKALHIAGGDVEKAAELLGIGRATAFRLIKSWEIETEKESPPGKGR